MKILLIKPKWFVKGGLYRLLENMKFTPLNLGILAALSEGHAVEVADGDWDEIPYDKAFDLVGITVSTFTSQEAYDIADRFRNTGAKVVLGGPHPSLMPQECLEHADSVVVGEAEYVWKGLLEDAAAGALKKTYQSDRLVDLDDVPFPKRDILNEPSWLACVQATRGCPNLCSYCYLPEVPWKTYRKRRVELVAEELRSIQQKIIYFVDDNLFADMDHARRLFAAIAPLKKKWSIQSPTTIGGDPALIGEMADAGCALVQIGFQTVNPSSLEWAAIHHNNIAGYRRLVKKLHAHSIIVTGFFMFGFDTDDKGIFARTEEMIREIGLDDANLYVLTPYPGTKLYEKFRRENRLLENKDRLNYGWANAVFRPANMSPEELEQGVADTTERLAGHFKRKLPLNLLEQLGWMARTPQLLYAVVSGGFGERDMKKTIKV